MDIDKIATNGLTAISTSKAEYGDIRYEILEDQNLSYSDGSPDPIENSISAGWSVRLLINGAWGFAASDDPRLPIEKLVQRAAEIAKASARVMKEPVVLSPRAAQTGEHITPHKIDPFSVPLKEKIDWLAHLDAAIGKYEILNSRRCFADFHKIEKRFYSTEGSRLRQTIIQSGAGMTLGQAKSHRERAERSYPRGSGQYECKGYELLDELDLIAAIPQLVEEVSALLSAPKCPQKTTTLVLDSKMTSMVIHESVGHALELDRVFGAERNFSGISFATPENLDNLKYASEIVNIVNDSTAEHGLGSFGWDDEGVKSSRTYLIKDGILKDYLSSRETAARIGKKSTGCIRASGWQEIPIVRMTNTILEPGNKSFADLIGEVEDGIYMSTVSSWSIDDLRKNFQFGCEIGWEIKNGKLAGVVKNPTFSDCTTHFWNNCDALGDASTFNIWGTPSCGKGQPGQIARTGEGAPAARFVNIEIGVDDDR